ncbi:MAG: hypothetical protein ACF8NJ_00290 [Phycisphaerales bacterium JB038]
MRKPDSDLSDRVPDEILTFLPAHTLHLAVAPAGAITIRAADGTALVWFSDEMGLMDGVVDGEAYDRLVGPWASVVYADLRHPELAYQLVNAITGGMDACGAEIVARDGVLVLHPSPDGEAQALSLAPVYLCASGDGEVTGLSEAEYRASLADDVATPEDGDIQPGAMP